MKKLSFWEWLFFEKCVTYGKLKTDFSFALPYKKYATSETLVGAWDNVYATWHAHGHVMRQRFWEPRGRASGIFGEQINDLKPDKIFLRIWF